MRKTTAKAGAMVYPICQFVNRPRKRCLPDSNSSMRSPAAGVTDQRRPVSTSVASWVRSDKSSAARRTGCGREPGCPSCGHWLQQEGRRATQLRKSQPLPQCRPPATCGSFKDARKPNVVHQGNIRAAAHLNHCPETFTRVNAPTCEVNFNKSAIRRFAVEKHRPVDRLPMKARRSRCKTGPAWDDECRDPNRPPSRRESARPARATSDLDSPASGRRAADKIPLSNRHPPVSREQSHLLGRNIQDRALQFHLFSVHAAVHQLFPRGLGRFRAGLYSQVSPTCGGKAAAKKSPASVTPSISTIPPVVVVAHSLAEYQMKMPPDESCNTHDQWDAQVMTPNARPAWGCAPCPVAGRESGRRK